MEDYFKKAILVPTDNTLHQFVKSALVGGLASVIDISVFSLGINILGINHIAANTLGFVFGLTINYLLSRKWVFNKKVHNTGRDFLLFSLIGFIGLILSNVLMFTLIDTGLLYIILAAFGDRAVKTFAKITVVVVVFFWNFIARKKIVFAT